MRSRSRRRLTVAAMGLAVLSTTACTTVASLVRDGRYQDAIDRANSRRRPPQGEQARAWAEALSATGRGDEARGILYADFQHGGDPRSLVSLADLEVALGLPGVAAIHYARIADLDTNVLTESPQGCALLRERADALARAGAGRAAHLDLSRAAAACGEPSDPRQVQRLDATRDAADAAQRLEVQADIVATQCRTDPSAAPCDTGVAPPSSAAAEALVTAAAAGLPALRQAAALHQASLTPEQVVALLVADMRAELGNAIIGDDEVRRWVGSSRWSDFAPLVMSQERGESAYLQLRLSAVMPDLPTDPDARGGPGQKTVWLAQSTDTAGDLGWRIFAWRGDLSATELSLSMMWRPRRPSTDTAPAAEASAAAPPTDPGAEGIAVPPHWSSRVVPSPDSLQAVLVLARLLYSRDRADQALHIARLAIRRALTAGVADGEAIAARFVAWHLAAGRVWHALAVADAAPAALATVRNAAGTGVLLADAFCGGACLHDDDAATVVRVMGQAWVDTTRGVAPTLAQAGRAALPNPGVCPDPVERLAAGGPLAEVLRRRDRSDPALPQTLARLVESDLTLGCQARDATTVWPDIAPSPTAESLVELLAHEPKAPNPDALLTLTRLALLADRHVAAEGLAVAAGASAVDPAATWRAIGAFADQTGDRDVELLALREMLLHTPGLHAPAAARALLLEILADTTRAWGLTETDAGRETLPRYVEEFVQGGAASQQWARREQLIGHVASQRWWVGGDADAPWRDTVVDALVGDASRSQHAVSLSRLGVQPVPVVRGAFDAQAWRAAAEQGGVSQLPTAARVFDDPTRTASVHLAIARHGDQWQTRWRYALGLALYGTARARAEGMDALLSMATPDQRRALLEHLLKLPAAAEPADAPALDTVGPVAPPRSAGVSPVALIDDNEVLLRVAARLDLAPAWFAR